MVRRPTIDEIRQMFSGRVAAPARDEAAPAIPPAPAHERRRALNKTEEEWRRRLAVLSPSSRVFAQPARFFALRGGGTYTPDFLEFRPSGLPVIVWEVKGGYRGPGWEQGYERYKRAALEHSDGIVFQFRMAEKRKGKWNIAGWNIGENK